MQKEQLKDLGEVLAGLLDPLEAEDAKLVQKGLMLYRQSQVYNVRSDEDGADALVQDVTPVRVWLDKETFDYSTCSCPAFGICRHMIAAFFALYAKSYSVGDWLDAWREPMNRMNAEMRAAERWGMQEAKDQVKASGAMKQPDYDSWVRTFEESFDSFMRSKNVNPYVVPELFNVYLRRLQAGAPMEQEWKLLYDLIGTVVSFRKLSLLTEEMGHTEDMAHRYYGHLFQKMMEDAEILIRKLGVVTLPFAFDEFIERFKDDVFWLLIDVSVLDYERFVLYRTLWTKLFKKKKWIEDERQKILPELKKVQNPLPLQMAGIHLSYLLKEDERAVGLIETMEDEEVVPFMPYMINAMSDVREWQRVSSYIEVFIGKIKGYLDTMHSYPCTDFTRIALKAVAPYCTETGRLDLYERALVQTLPYSYREYEFFLFDQGQWEKWGELNAFIGFQLNEMPSDRLKQVEKAQPEVLLSLYHQSVHDHLEQKNRQSYKVAVRHLKKLRTIYKKLKRQDEWISFFERLLEKTKRLRAFHEECRRSKLIDA